MAPQFLAAGKLTTTLAPSDEDTSQVQFTDTDEDAADLVAQKSRERTIGSSQLYCSAVELRLHTRDAFQ